MTADTRTSEPYAIDAGQSWQFWGRRGTVIHITAGKAYLAEAPRWLADTLCREPHLLLGGSNYVLQETGWVLLHAVTRTQLMRHRQCQAHPLLARMAAWLRHPLTRRYPTATGQRLT